MTAPHLTQENCLCSLDRSAGYRNSITGTSFVPSDVFVGYRNVLFHVKHFADLYRDLVTGTAYTYLLTPWSRAPLEKLIDSAASQEIPRISGTRRFLTVPTSAHHLSLS